MKIQDRIRVVEQAKFSQATSSATTQIADWELEEFRRAVELLETHYRNFYDKASANVNASRPRIENAELRRLDHVESLFHLQHI